MCIHKTYKHIKHTTLKEIELFNNNWSEIDIRIREN